MFSRFSFIIVEKVCSVLIVIIVKSIALLSYRLEMWKIWKGHW